jgi:hypothetical protein
MYQFLRGLLIQHKENVRQHPESDAINQEVLQGADEIQEMQNDAKTPDKTVGGKIVSLFKKVQEHMKNGYKMSVVTVLRILNLAYNMIKYTAILSGILVALIVPALYIVEKVWKFLTLTYDANVLGLTYHFFETCFMTVKLFAACLITISLQDFLIPRNIHHSALKYIRLILAFLPVIAAANYRYRTHWLQLMNTVANTLAAAYRSNPSLSFLKDAARKLVLSSQF